MTVAAKPTPAAAAAAASIMYTVKQDDAVKAWQSHDNIALPPGETAKRAVL